jgi:hypothetical protein
MLKPGGNATWVRGWPVFHDSERDQDSADKAQDGAMGNVMTLMNTLPTSP